MNQDSQSAGQQKCVRSVSDRSGNITVKELIARYMAEYSGRDPTRVQRLGWWSVRLGDTPIAQVTDDEIYFALEDLAARPGRYWAGIDADGRPIMKAKRKPMAPATVNRYAASLGAVFTWAIRKRIVPRGWESPCRRIERRPESNERIRFLSDDERERLLTACRASRWPRLYLLVLMAITTGARKGELFGLRWSDIDLNRSIAYVNRTKNGEPKVLPLLPAVVDEARRFVSNDGPEALLFASRLNPNKPYTVEASTWPTTLRAAKLRDFRFHDLRHTCASYLAQSGASLLEIGEVLGHRQPSVTKRYAHLTVGNKAKLVNRVLGDIR